jgi:hypothetical protein
MAILALAGCVSIDYGARQIVGSGKLVTRDFQLSDFTGVEIGNAFQVDITRADTFSVSITTDDNLFDYLRVEKRGAHLVVQFADGYSIRPTSGLRAKITMPAIEQARFSGATNATLAGFKSNKYFDAQVSGASKLTGDLDAGDARLEASGASAITLRGVAQNARFIASGASTLNLGDFIVEVADVELSGASNGTLGAKSKLGYNLSGASHLTYTGNPSITQSNATGASSATKK